MCLELKSSDVKRIKADADIICYKVIIISGGHYKTPYRKSVIKIGGCYSGRLRKEPNSTINFGFHSFMDKESAIDIAYYISKSTEIVRCVIPKGSWYYEGLFGNYKCYASNKINYLEVII